MSRNSFLLLLCFALLSCQERDVVSVPGSCIANRCAKAFQIDATEVTQGAYERVMGVNPSTGPECGPDCPVESVEWAEAQKYCVTLGKRLPSSLEWELAARAGNLGEWPEQGWSPDDLAWYADNSDGRVHAVASTEPNALGIYDMMGNVAEWTADHHGAPTGSLRTVCGGHWSSPLSELKFSNKKGYMEADRGELLGFRCAREETEP